MELSHPANAMEPAVSAGLERKVNAQAEELRALRAQLDDVLRRVQALESRPPAPAAPTPRRSALPQRQTSASSLRSESPPPAPSTPPSGQSQASVSPGAGPASQSKVGVSSGAGPGGSLALSKRWSSTGDFNQSRQSVHSVARLAAAKSLFNLSAGVRGLAPPPEEADWSEAERCVRVAGAVLLAPAGLVVDGNHVTPPPSRRLRLDWVHGFRGRDARSCLHLLPTGEVVYLSACVVVLHGLREATQRHYLGHSDAVLCVAVHPNKMTLASGQAGSRPHIRVWDSVSLATVACVGLGHFDSPVRCVGFSKADGGVVLCAVDDSPDHVLSLWAWQRGTLIAHAKSSCEAVTWAEFHPLDAALVTAGKDHLSFWTAHGQTLYKMAAVFDARTRPKFVTAVAFAQSGATISGDSSGNITLWARGGPVVGLAARGVHAGPVLWLLPLRDGRLVSGGGRDGRIVTLDERLRLLAELTLPADVGGARVIVDARQGRFIVGTTRNCVLEGTLESGFEVVVRGHADSVLALSAHPTLEQHAAGAADGLVVVRDADTHADLSHYQLPAGCHSMDHAPDGSALVAGLSDGRWLLLGLTESGAVDGVLGGGTAGEHPLTAVAFSPDGTQLALGTADGSVFVHAGRPRFDRVGRCLGHSAAVSSIDWSDDGQLFRTNSANGELLFWSSSSCRQVSATSRPRDAEWAGLTCALTFDTAGGTAGGVAPCAGHAHRGSGLLALGDGDGALRLTAFPARPPRALAHRGLAHAAAVAALRFSRSGQVLASAGAADCTLALWRLH